MIKSSGTLHSRPAALAGAVALVLVSCGGSNGGTAGPPILSVYGDQPEMRVSQMDAAAGEQLTMLARMRFEIDGELPALDGPAPAYEISAREPNPDDVNTIARIFGIEGELVAQSAQAGGGYVAGATDGSGPAIYVSGDAIQYWNYSPPWTQSAIDPTCVEPEGIAPVAPPTPVSDSVVVADTEAPVPVDSLAPVDDVTTAGEDPCADAGVPQDVPDDDQARQMFIDLMSDIGVDAGSLDIEVFSDAYGASVSGFLRIGGVRSSLSWSASYGDAGRVMWAGGVLADAEKLAEYSRIGTSAALDRLNEQQARLVDQVTRGEDLAAASGAAAGDEIVVRVIDVEEELVMLYGVDGTAYLVPGYAFLAEPDEFGYRPRYTVSAMPDEYLDIVAPPAPDDSSTGMEPGGNADGSGSENTGGEMPNGEQMNEITTEQANTLLGMTEAEATSTAEANGWVVRIAARDGEQFALTMDYNWQRVNLTVEGGVVTDVFIG